MRKTTLILLLPLLASSAAWAQLQPPQGYRAAVEHSGDDPQRCEAAPAPYTGSLYFSSKYEGSGKARATLNKDAERRYREKTRDITALEKGVNQYVYRYMRHGNAAELDCALSWLDGWASAGALLSQDYNHTGKSMRKWALGSLAGAYLRLKFSSSQPLADQSERAQRIEQWFARVAEQVERDWDGLPREKVNNHTYWAAWSVMAAAVATDRQDLFDWSVERFRYATGQVDADGFLPNELRRKPRALSYHNYSLPPLAMIASFALANGVDLRQENDAALQRLAERVLEGREHPEAFAKRTGAKQEMKDMGEGYKYAWLEPYCELYRCSPELARWKQEMEPLKNTRLGGDMTALYSPEHEEGSDG